MEEKVRFARRAAAWFILLIWETVNSVALPSPYHRHRAMQKYAVFIHLIIIELHQKVKSGNQPPNLGKVFEKIQEDTLKVINCMHYS